MKLYLIAFTYLLLTGCAGMNYVLENYQDSTFHEHAMPEDTYRIFDKPEENRLMITPSFGSMVGSGAERGLLGANPSGQPQPVYQKAVLSFLASTGRDCKIVEGYLIVSPQWEFKYDCSTGS